MPLGISIGWQIGTRAMCASKGESHELPVQCAGTGTGALCTSKAGRIRSPSHLVPAPLSQGVLCALPAKAHRAPTL